MKKKLYEARDHLMGGISYALPVIIGGPEESTEKNVIEQRKDKESKSKKCDICSHQWIADIGRGILQNCHSQHSHHDQKEKRN